MIEGKMCWELTMSQRNGMPDQVTANKLRDSISKSYPAGWFVAIADEQIVEAAATFRELRGCLQKKGYDPRMLIVVEAGVDDPEFVNILAGARDRRPQFHSFNEIPTR